MADCFTAVSCERVISRFANSRPPKQPSDNSHPKPDRPLPAFGTFLIGNLRFLDPKISTCYGCRQPLKPNQSIPREPEDLVIVGRARREYWKNGEKVISSELSNVYFHVNAKRIKHTLGTDELYRFKQIGCKLTGKLSL